MRAKVVLTALLVNALVAADSFAQTMPLVYDVENTGADCPKPPLPSFSQLPIIQALPDLFAWADGRGRMSYYSDWRIRRSEIGAQIQNYEIGQKPPRPDTITASYSGSVLTVQVTVNGKTLTLTSQVVLPAGAGPFPAVIGMNSPTGSIPSTIFVSRNIAQITYVHNQVTTYGSPSTSNPYYQLYPNLDITNTGQYSAWAWGVSRIIDGLELVQNVLPIDLKHLCVTGCSYAGKMALFAGAFDERIALTIAQESGGGGATSWRYSQSEPNGTVEKIDNTDYNWFMNSMAQFSGNNVSRLPEDHHELMAMCAPRALYVTANPDYTWLSNPSCYVCSNACKEVYTALGIADRFGYSVVGGHTHCQVPGSQIPEIGAFVDKFLLGQDTANTANIADTWGYTIDLSPWITWSNPTLANGTTYFATLAYPPDGEKGVDTSLTFRWKRLSAAEEYYFQLSSDPTFTSIAISDSTTDTVKTVTGLQKGRPHYWRVRVRTADGLGIWSAVWQFITTTPLPSMPVLGTVTHDTSGISNGFIFHWNKTLYADQYLLQTAYDSTFTSVNHAVSTSETSRTISGFLVGRLYYWRVQASNYLGSGPWSNVGSFIASPTDVTEEGRVPIEYALRQNYPNPFNPTTTIQYSVQQASHVELRIYDSLGRLIKTLVDEWKNSGDYTVAWDAKNTIGKAVPSGVYYYRIVTGTFTSAKKMICVK
jgi:hypothetical protein